MQMIENTFGPGRQTLVHCDRRLLAEGMLGVKEETGGKLRSKHFFLFVCPYIYTAVMVTCWLYS